MYVKILELLHICSCESYKEKMVLRQTFCTLCWVEWGQVKSIEFLGLDRAGGTEAGEERVPPIASINRGSEGSSGPIPTAVLIQ